VLLLAFGQLLLTVRKVSFAEYLNFGWFIHNHSVNAGENLQSNSLTNSICHPSFPAGVIVTLSLQVFSL